jgi:hypothetical protein
MCMLLGVCASRSVSRGCVWVQRSAPTRHVSSEVQWCPTGTPRWMSVPSVTLYPRLLCRLLSHRRAHPRGTDGDPGDGHATRHAAAGSEHASGADARIPSLQLFLPPCLTIKASPAQHWWVVRMPLVLVAYARWASSCSATRSKSQRRSRMLRPERALDTSSYLPEHNSAHGKHYRGHDLG